MQTSSVRGGRLLLLPQHGLSTSALVISIVGSLAKLAGRQAAQKFISISSRDPRIGSSKIGSTTGEVGAVG